MRTVSIICGTLLVFSALICGGELLEAAEAARWGLSGAVGAGSLVGMIDRAGQALIELSTAPPMWRLLLGGSLLHWSLRV